ncbi:MAG: TrmJ/YjtD family RNA methyltransferase [Acidobacteriota bacterium]|nr:TrmJ/YjtD family RNA methyltransferase [Acidobacteriota bacterium]
MQPDPAKPDPTLGRISIILVRARNPANIGAVARAMHDFGFTNLRVVNEFAVPFEAARSAVDASAVLSAARSFSTLEEALADCTLVVGTTAVGERELRHPLLTLPAAAPQLRRHLGAEPHTRIALLFGSEKTGLSNEELSFCHLLLTIPMYPHPDVRHPSMNLGQAVAVCLYELTRMDAPSNTPAAPDDLMLPPSAEIERLTALLREMLEEIGYTQHHPANTSAPELRRLVRRMGADVRSAPVWMGIFRQVLWKARQGSPLPRTSQP